ncbi:MAG: class I SAM-dependent methyltransferase [Pseudomonadota bacterium]
MQRPQDGPILQGDSAPISHHEFCTFCGVFGPMLETKPNRPFSHNCAACGASVRHRGQAGALLSLYGKGRWRDFTSAVKDGAFAKLDIYEIAIKGPLKRHLQNSDRYVNSYFWEDLAPGAWKGAVQCQDLTRLTYADACFDLVLSTEVMEHVHDPWKAFEEVARVLRPGGSYVFTIPVRLPLPPASITRATLNPDVQIEHLLPERYHRSGIGGDSLVFTDFGSDIFDRVREIGLHMTSHIASNANTTDSQFCTFVATKYV